MEAIRSIWLFFQDQILGMKWLNALIGKGLETLGLDSVSYTHLDVYKRQGKTCSVRSNKLAGNKGLCTILVWQPLVTGRFI